MREKLAPELLNATYANEDGTMDLEFQLDGQMVYIRNVKIDDPTDEFYWDDDEVVQKAIDGANDEDIDAE